MSLTLLYHPLSSFCWKALVALYENGAPFAANMVNLGDSAERAALLALSPIGRFPVLRDETRGETVPESSIVIEYLDRHYPGAVRLIPENPDLALQTRLRDRFLDLYVHLPMQKVVGDRLRPADSKDPHGVAEARAQLRTSYAILDQQLILNQQRAHGGWMMGEHFSLADCAAAPTMFYGNKVEPFGDGHRHLAAYLERLMARPSFARVLREAEPYFGMFPQET
ncbi:MULTISPECIES: glutathione S-transferase family protein [Bradyrhizobium]|jgi:glutathione S-transferase|uniref:Glutathione S-transferase n=1 Tax=Bradyrhizobium elkanii TaxID=29448 RepID=A0A8I2C369_BRAEL|nr:MULTISPECIES: glutathione S-transferase family protein [Bradyrhizobium]MBP1291066.1 glutathione S-transferase [Bradyrhizobium elkanii]MCP1928617.1 glutathione S-transferase [Bradyrhizobium elkanii]MCS3474059.1 glutathione S-transferase [Bradyrhizobium elkanii]MCS3580767.1 glutathione S-transferase [Bradyrhizobium elkanii]MCS3723643.1 glutathione S-transferase [Bradyrhizobium elkanii]